MENFSLIATNAQKLKGLSQSADWKLRATREYQRFTPDFERAAAALERSARNRNVDAATVAYFRLTTTCVTCHKYLRGADVGSCEWERGVHPASMRAGARLFGQIPASTKFGRESGMNTALLRIVASGPMPAALLQRDE